MEKSISVNIRNLSVGYGHEAVLRGISFQLMKGELVLLVGANGSGKSTLLKTMASCVAPLSGEVSVSGDCAMVPSRIPKVKGFTVREFIATSLYASSGALGKLGQEEQRRVESAISLLGLSDLSDKDISCISDGEFQKACIATAVCRRSDVILLDEPTAFLDVPSRVAVLDGLLSLSHDSGKCIMFSSHDVLDAVKVCDRVVAILPGGTVEISDRTMEKKRLLLQKCFPVLNV